MPTGAMAPSAPPPRYATARRETPSLAFFARLHARLSESGFFIVDKQEQEWKVRATNIEETVLDLVQNDSGTSMRTIAFMSGFSI
ncbi:hypothetical protein TNCV_3740031 [Trichonephila clavipes]|nr:hypothetical protein TNCV_3740031 [Trichonephila clavipes]